MKGKQTTNSLGLLTISCMVNTAGVGMWGCGALTDQKTLSCLADLRFSSLYSQDALQM